MARVKYRFIANPTARSGRGRGRWERIRALLDGRGVSYEWCPSEWPGHAVELAREAGQGAAEVAVAVGGDGTINEVLCGVMQAREARSGESCALGIVYTGTSPDVCRYHGIPVAPTEAAVEVLLRDGRHRVDVGRVEYFERDDPGNTWAGAGARATTGYFLCSVNLGMGAAVAAGSNGGLRRYLGDGLGTFASILAAVAGYRHADLVCRVDGEPLRNEKTWNLTVGKNPFIASGLKVLVPVQPDDGRLYLFAVNGFSLWGLLGNLHRFYQGTFQNHPQNRLLFLERFECDYAAEAPQVEFDGDPRGYLPCRVTVLRQGLELVK